MVFIRCIMLSSFKINLQRQLIFNGFIFLFYGNVKISKNVLIICSYNLRNNFIFMSFIDGKKLISFYSNYLRTFKIWSVYQLHLTFSFLIPISIVLETF